MPVAILLGKQGRVLKGGEGSGNFGHAGRPGEVGGSAATDLDAVAAAITARKQMPTQVLGGVIVGQQTRFAAKGKWAVVDHNGGFAGPFEATPERAVAAHRRLAEEAAQRARADDAYGEAADRVLAGTHTPADLRTIAGGGTKITRTGIERLLKRYGWKDKQIRSFVSRLGIYGETGGGATLYSPAEVVERVQGMNTQKGGGGSGNFGHHGIPGHRGGSAPNGGPQGPAGQDDWTMADFETDDGSGGAPTHDELVAWLRGDETPEPAPKPAPKPPAKPAPKPAAAPAAPQPKGPAFRYLNKNDPWVAELEAKRTAFLAEVSALPDRNKLEEMYQNAVANAWNNRNTPDAKELNLYCEKLKTDIGRAAAAERTVLLKYFGNAKKQKWPMPKNNETLQNTFRGTTMQAEMDEATDFIQRAVEHWPEKMPRSGRAPANKRLPPLPLEAGYSPTLDRAYYQGNWAAPTIMLNPNDTAWKIIHETGHFLDEKGSTNGLPNARYLTGFRDARAPKSTPAKRLEGFGYDADEVTRPDDFIHPYVGKDYQGGSSNEVLSMGIQYLYESPRRLATVDPEHFVLTWGILKGTARLPSQATGKSWSGRIVVKGGPGSGFHGHAGRPGERGGSQARRNPLEEAVARMKEAGVQRTVDTSQVDNMDLGRAAYIEDGKLVTFHVTDDAATLMRTLDEHADLRGGTPHSELGSGLYGSTVPDYWMGRSTDKYSFLNKLDKSERTRLADLLQQQLDRAKGHFITPSEYDRGVRNLHSFVEQNSHYGAVSLAEQPYNFRFWKPEWLTEHGFEPGKQPAIVRIEARGVFAEVDQSLGETGSQKLIDLGFDGAYMVGGWSNDPQVVIWNPKAIVGYQEEETTIKAFFLTALGFIKGGDGSGNFGHAGRPGERGGSAPAHGYVAGHTLRLQDLPSYGQDMARAPDDPNRVQDVLLGQILHAQGFDGLPTVVSEAEYADLLARGEITKDLWRGVHGNNAYAERAEQFRSGPLWTGKGVWGNGIYATTERDVANLYARGHPEGLLHVGLRKGAKVISRADLADKQAEILNLDKPNLNPEERQARLRSLFEQLNAANARGDTEAASELESELVYTVHERPFTHREEIAQDPGRRAAFLGYDAVDVDGQEIVILNRTALYVVKP